MKLYGHYISLTTLQVLLLLAEKKHAAQFELVDVFAKAQKSPAHRALHPFGHIPVLDDGDFRIYETHAILRYLDSRLHGLTFVPADVQERARMDQWLCIEQNYLLPAAKKVMSRGYAQMMGLPDPGQTVVDEGLRELEFCLEQFVRWMAGKTYVAGRTVSLADLCWAADFHEMSAQFKSVPLLTDARMTQWRERMSARPAWTAAIQERASHAPAQA